MIKFFIILICFLVSPSLRSQVKISPFSVLSKNEIINTSSFQNQISNQIQSSDVNYNNIRDLTGSAIAIINLVDRYDGTVDIVIGLNSQSPDTSYIDAVRYTFPDNIIINSGDVVVGTMPDSTTSAQCDISFEVGTNSIIFGDASFIDDPFTGSSWGCIGTDSHEHVVNVNMFTDDVEIGYYLADDCYSTCNDIDGHAIIFFCKSRIGHRSHKTCHKHKC